MSKAAMRLEKIKDTKDMSKREKHNIRSVNVSSSDNRGQVVIKGIRGIVKHIKALEKQMNINLKAQGKRAVRKDAVKLIEVIMTSDSEFFKKYDYNKYFEDCEEFLEGFWGKGNIVQSCLHTDELTPHVHYFITPIKGDKFNYSKFINGRDDLSDYQEQLERFMLEKGYDIEHRALASLTRKKHKTTREWSAEMQVAKNMAELMDSKTLQDTAINGVINAKEIDRLSSKLEVVTKINFELKTELDNVSNDRDKWKAKYSNLSTGVADMTKDKGMIKIIEDRGYKKNQEKQKHKRNTQYRGKHKNEKILKNEDVEH